MTTPLVISLAYGVVAALANLGGAHVCARGAPPGQSGRLAGFRAVSAGFLVGVILIDALPGGLGAWRGQWWVAVLLVVLGYAALHGIERLFARAHEHHAHCESDHASALSSTAAWTGVLGLALHTLLDGAAVASTTFTGTANGALMAASLVVHQVPVGASAAALALTATGSVARARAAGGMVAIASVAGALAFALAGRVAPFALPLMAGITLHVVVHDLLPTLGRQGRRRAALLVAVGVGLYGATEALVHLAGT